MSLVLETFYKVVYFIIKIDFFIVDTVYSLQIDTLDYSVYPQYNQSYSSKFTDPVFQSYRKIPIFMVSKCTNYFLYFRNTKLKVYAKILKILVKILS